MPSASNKVNALFTIPGYRGGMFVHSLQLRAEKMLLMVLWLVMAGVALAFAQPALAQTTTTYSNATTGTVDGSTVCTSPLIRNINVSDSYTIGDVNIGILATHTWRGDLQFTLISPSNTSVLLTVGDVNNLNGDNFNVLLDDGAAQEVNTDGNTVAHSGTAPPFQNTFFPNNPLSAFNGENSNGTWRLEICDLFPNADDGTFLRADLILTSVPANFADLSLTKTLIGATPNQGATANWELTVSNAALSTDTATGIVVNDTLPAGFDFSSATGDGTFDEISGDWTVGSLAPGASATLTITGTITAFSGTTITNSAEITASSVQDIDSTVNNGVTSEDDYAESSFVVAAGRTPGIPPVLSCPAGQSIFDWDAVSGWNAGDTSNSFAFETFGNVDFSLSNDGVYVNNAIWGGATPNVGNYFNGGLSPVENVLQVVSNQANQTGAVVLSITLPRSFTGLQFSVFDVDFGAGNFADRLTVTGSNGGTSVNPTLTNGVVNFVSGNTVIGDGAAGNNEGTGNVVVTFTSAVDTITIRYDNHTTAPADPNQQGIGIHDITVCDPFTTLSVSKVSTVLSDPVNGTTDPKAIPGATIEYLITVTNTGSEATDAGTVVVWDDAPVDAKMCLMARSGGPVIFADPGSNSGLTYDYGGAGTVAGDLQVVGDDLEFSENDGVNFNYQPSDEGDGCDGNITDFRVNPAGGLAAGGNFTLTVRFEVR